MMEMIIDFPGGSRVNTQVGPFTVTTDKSVAGGGEGTAPTPFQLFLASLGACAGIYVLSFCQQRGLPTDEIRLVQRILPDPDSKLIGQIEIEIHVPPSFPERYHTALIRATEQCTVKKQLEKPPAIDTMVVVRAALPAQP
jgi:putative redox protein